MQFGYITINWKNRTFEVYGMNGEQPEMSAKTVLEALEQADELKKTYPDIETMALVLDDTQQLCFYDLEMFRDECSAELEDE